MNKTNLFIASLVALTFFSCSSQKEAVRENNSPSETVISRIDAMPSRPAWLKESEPFSVEGSKLVALGSATIPGNHRLEAAFRIAENNAKNIFSNSISQKLSYVFQNAEEGTSMEGNTSSFIGGEVSRLVTSSLRLKNRYWERVHVINENGAPSLIYKVFATVSMEDSEFRSTLDRVLKKAEAKNEISPGMVKKIEKHWDELTKSE